MREAIADLLGLVAGADAAYLLPFLLLVLLHFLAEPLRWHIYVRDEVSPARYARVLQIFSLTAFITYLMPVKMGLPVRVLLLRTKLGLGLGRISSLLVLDGLMYYGAWGGAALASLLAAAGRYGVPARTSELIAAAVAVLAVSLLAWLARGRLLPGPLLARLRARTGERFRALREFGRGTRPGLAGLSAAVIVADVTSQVLRHWAMLAMLGVSLSWLQLCLITTVSMFTGFISLMPMGLGGYDAMLILLLAQASVPAEVGISTALANRLGSVAVSAVLGMWGGYRLGLSPFRRQWMRSA